MIYNYGSLNIDYVYTVNDFVRQGETIASLDMQTFAGGKGLNQSIALAKAGAAVRHCGFVSKESPFLLDTLQDAGVDVSLIQKVESVNGHAIIQVNHKGQNCILLYGGTNQMLDETYAQQVSDHMAPGDVVLFQNETSCTGTMMALAKEKGAVIALNPSPMNEACLQLPLHLVDIFILNEHEGAALTQQEAPQDIVAHMQQLYPQVKIVLTLGEAGALFAQGGECFAQKAVTVAPHQVVDTTAAGDTFTGYYLAGLCSGLSDKQALQRAAAAAALTVTKAGAAQSIPLSQEVDAACG